MTKKALSINFPLERAVLSDFSPFEVPITFSNRHFYNFLVKNELKHDGLNFLWKSSCESMDKLVLLLLGLSQTTVVESSFSDGERYKKTKIEGWHLPSIPFTFPISHKHNEYRYLSVIHPKGQILAVDFYKIFKDLITYYSDQSPFSLRAPKKVAACTYIDSRSIIESYDKEDLGIELEGQDYENLRSFFVYKKYKNIFEFYESSEHHWCEKRFNYLSKLDVSHCFDSIYTHSIAWAVFKKKYAKQNLSKTKNTFAYKFDELMQRINYNETNGILIGPELSRIFAEIIMQAIDKDVFMDLDGFGFSLGADYQIYRYVDDYFIFYNDESIFLDIKSSIRANLKLYKLSLNTHKEETFTRPIITPISIAKNKISSLISEEVSYKFEKKENEFEEIIEGNIYINQRKLSTDFKSILAETGITYSDVLNYTLAIVEKKVKEILKNYKEIPESESSSRQLINSLVSIINFIYFIYAVAPKVSSTIKLCRVLQLVILFIKDQKIGIEYQHIMFKCIFDNTCSILEKNSVSNVTAIETLYLVFLIRQLGKYYWLDQSTLIKYFKVKKRGDEFFFEENLNYFTITSLLFYISNKKRYSSLKSGLLNHIKFLYDERKDTLLSDAELVHLTLDLTTCPYIDVSFKAHLLKNYGISKSHVKKIVSLNEVWFTKWKNFNFAKELDAKLSNDVY